jgi:hypothetical protein
MTSKLSTLPEFTELLAAAQTSAVHLELRDAYFSNPRFEAWRTGDRVDWDDRSSWWMPYHQAIADAVARGVVVRRARVVSEPVTDYIRWEHYQTTANIEAGEQVRWLPRAQATRLLLPGTDCWIFDGALVRAHHFSGDGDWIGTELLDDAEAVSRSAEAFETIWAHATPHDEYKIK